jgi:CelD/BcsL family acetyltransferase involved in cellulose biosynthesis
LANVIEIANSATADRASKGNAAIALSQLETPHLGAVPLGTVRAEQWRALAERAVEPNGYYLREWALAVNGSAQKRERTSALAAHNAATRALTGLIPVISAWSAYRLPLPALVSADPFRSLDTPLLDQDHPVEAAAALLDQACQSGAHALILRLVPLEGPAMKAFGRALDANGLRPRVLQSYSRACLDATQDAETLLRDALGSKKLKELRRLRHRLGDLGEVRFEVASRADDIERAFDGFLALEASGWKGKAGTAMAQHADDAARMRHAMIELAARGQCEVVTLSAGTTAVAAGIVLRHQDRAFFFKIGIDERFAKFSPGVQLTLDLTRHLCADPRIAMADSTASAEHPMINPIWRGRLTIGDVLLPLRRNDPMVPVIHAALRAHGFARAMALRLLRR